MRQVMSILCKELISGNEYPVFCINKWRFYFYVICAKIDIEFPLFGVRGGLNVYRLQSRRKRYRHGEELLNPNRKANCHN